MRSDFSNSTRREFFKFGTIADIVLGNFRENLKMEEGQKIELLMIELSFPPMVVADLFRLSPPYPCGFGEPQS